jgi:hypothetical protein
VLLYNFERGALAMARGGTGEQRSNSVDRLPTAANHAADIALAKLKFKNGCSATRNFREHHVVRIFDQLPNDELEKFSHDGRLTTNAHESTRISAGIKSPGVRQPPSPNQRRLRDSATFSIIHFRSGSVPQLAFLRRMAPTTPALLPRAQIVQTVQTQVPLRHWLPVFYFS